MTTTRVDININYPMLYRFGYSLTDNVMSVMNWQEGNGTFFGVPNGTVYFFIENTYDDSQPTIRAEKQVQCICMLEIESITETKVVPCKLEIASITEIKVVPCKLEIASITEQKVTPTCTLEIASITEQKVPVICTLMIASIEEKLVSAFDNGFSDGFGTGQGSPPNPPVCSLQIDSIVELKKYSFTDGFTQAFS